MAIAEDASTPAVSATSAGNGTQTTASFSPPAGSLLVAVAVANYIQSGTSSIALSDSTGGTWTIPTGAEVAVNDSRIKIGTRYLASAPGAMTVSAAMVLTDGRWLAVRVLTGADPTQASPVTATANATSTAGGLAMTPTAGSFVYGGVANTSNSTQTLTANAASVLLTPLSNPSNSWTAGFRSAAAASGSATTYGGTFTASCIHLLLAMEVKAATGGPTGPEPGRFLLA